MESSPKNLQQVLDSLLEIARIDLSQRNSDTDFKLQHVGMALQTLDNLSANASSNRKIIRRTTSHIASRWVDLLADLNHAWWINGQFDQQGQLESSEGVVFGTESGSAVACGVGFLFVRFP